jgi:hypothetical protein
LILGDVGEVVEDQQVILVDFGNGGFEREFAPGDLEPLDEIGGVGEQNAPAVFDRGEAERCRQVALSAAGWAEPDLVAPFSSQLSPAAGPSTRTASESKLSRVLPGGNLASAR